MHSISKFIKDHIPLCVCTLGIAILGYLGYHAVRWIINKCHKTEEIDRVAQKTISSTSPQKPSSSSNHITNPQILPLPQTTATSQSEEVQMDEIALRQNNLKVTLAVTKIQSVSQKHLARLALKKLQVEKLERQKSAAAIKIQRIWRGHLARIKVEKAKRHVLSYALLEKAKPYVDVPSNQKDLPRAPNGRTRVYLPKELPIVLKLSGFPKNRERFRRMRQARDICEENGYQHLVIPKARVYGNFIIESRLPITMHGMHMTKGQIGLYIENRERFADAVKEFTGFLCQSTLDDITGGIYDPYETLSETPMGRYDNITLYLEGNQGKIGLIDLEQFKPGPSEWEKRYGFNSYSRCQDAVHLFPYHLDEIISAAQKFNSNIETYRRKLEIERDGTLKRFKLAYEDHLEFVTKKGIRLENPISFEKLGTDRIGQLKKVIEQKLREEHERPWFEGCLGEEPNKTLISFNEEAFPKILDATYKLIKDNLKFNLEDQKSKGDISTNAQLLLIRTLNLEIRYDPYDEFRESISKSVEMLDIGSSSYEIDNFARLLLDVILKELKKGGEIAYYNRWFGCGDYAIQCVFC